MLPHSHRCVRAERGGRADDRAHVERLRHRVEQHGQARVAGPAPLPVEPFDLGGAQLPGRAGPGRAPDGSRAAHPGPFGLIVHLEQAVTAPCGQPGHRPALPGQPAVQRVGAQVAPDHQVGVARRAPAGPASRTAARAARPCRCGPAGWTRSRRTWPGSAASPGGRQRTLARPARPGVPRAQLERPLVDVDRPHRGARRPGGQHAGDRAVAAAQVEQVAARPAARGPPRAAGGCPGRAGRGRTPRRRWPAPGTRRAGSPGPGRAGAARRAGRRSSGRVTGLTGCPVAGTVGWAWPDPSPRAGLMKRRVTQRSTMNVMIGTVPASSMITVGLAASRSLRASSQAHDQVDDVQDAVHHADVVGHGRVPRHLERDADEAQDHQHHAGHVGHHPVPQHRCLSLVSYRCSYRSPCHRPWPLTSALSRAR